MQRRNFMLKTTAALAFGGLALAGCTTNKGNPDTPATDSSKRQSIDASVEGTMSRLFTTVQGSRKLVSKARGVLVFPSVLQVGFIVGGQYGEGSLKVGGGTVGIVAGVNFAMSDMILAGLEFQGGVMWPDSDWDWEAYALGRVGVTVSDGIMAYGAAGLGRASGAGVYAFGGGVEVAAFDPISVRGEILGVGEWGEGPSAAKATAGVLFHFN